MKSCLILSCLMLIFTHTWCQDREITGTIYAFNKYPLKNVKVVAKKAKSEARTNENGEFNISTKANDVLIVEAETFETYRYQLKPSDKSLRLNLIYKDKQKNKDIATSEGYISRENLEYGLQNLTEQNNAFSNFTDVFDAIKYALPATTIIMENGQRRIQIRGPQSLTGSNAALMVVNGVIVDDVSFIVPSQILSIKQLYGASAAIYGARGGKGVVSITTK
jgi:TonB-dependent Receptor Plug Domain